ncbi:hypothetical protein [Streptomyces platensis]|uniref:hypothetical protein n=1 Tax=Streptomyces platensis TaxID=58346 RepID=UPI0037981290
MENDGTTPPEGGSRKRAQRHLRARRRLHDLRPRRPLWQEPLRGALYAAGSGVIGLLVAGIQHWMW